MGRTYVKNEREVIKDSNSKMGSSHKRTIGKKLKEIEKQAKNKVGAVNGQNQTTAVENSYSKMGGPYQRNVTKG
jgi:hypothetical protein